MKNPPVVLLTDFGYADEFSGVLRGVLLSINPNCSIVDLTHGIRPQDIFHASFVLASSASFFPAGSIFLVVVDPGVGTDRRALLLRAGGYYFIGPDNGVLYSAATELGIDTMIQLTNPEYFLHPVSSTFHGRDIFAPAAAHLSLGKPMNSFGTSCTNILPLEVPRPLPCEQPYEHGLVLRILHVDHFGNMILNIRGKEFLQWKKRNFLIEIPIQNTSIRISSFCSAYEQAPDNEPVILISSSGYAEIAVKNASAWKFLHLDSMDTQIFLIPGDSKPHYQ